ncbi:terminase small subunit, partial [bacterium]|nr:terminase small subunit [bacterium]
KAYQKVYPDSEYDSAKVNASKLLTNTNIKDKIEELTRDIEKNLGISKAKIVKEFMSIGFSRFNTINRDWLTQREFNELTDEEMACIAEVKKEVITIDDNVSKEVLKIKLHDKQRALENLSKLLGYNEPEKHEHKIQQIEIIEKKRE